MLAHIYEIASAKHALLYNERKVQAQTASFLDARNLPLPPAQLTTAIKKDFFTYWEAHNLSSRVQGLHVFLSFSPQDDLSTQRLQSISRNYMEEIRFGQQPYLVYQHHDTYFRHLHLVSSCIDAQGKRINTHNLASKRSFAAVEVINQQYGLQGVGKLPPSDHLRPALARFGTQPTKQSLEQIVHFLLANYSFTDFASWSALLSKYRIKPILLAARGGSSYRGLVYRLTDELGRNCSVGIPASELAGAPTLRHLEEHFFKYRLSSQQDIDRMNKIVQVVFRSSGQPLAESMAQLRSQGIEAREVKDPMNAQRSLVWIDYTKRFAVSSERLQIDQELTQKVAQFLRLPHPPEQRMIPENPRLSKKL